MFLSDKPHMPMLLKKKKKPEPQPVVYDDEFDGDDEEEENVPVTVPPPRVQHEEIELKPMASQSQPEAGPSRLAVITTQRLSLRLHHTDLPILPRRLFVAAYRDTIAVFRVTFSMLSVIAYVKESI
ncbi:hypothetical protein EDD22DRAFT_973888 [Suillus occidentalis]|nr:hypothetical protein EDD22DRAFT_973888 [Suillus occidentalis]